MTDNIKILRGWASQPWETNFELIPGLTALVNNEPEFAQKLLVKFCPRAFSPSQRLDEEVQQGYLKIHEEGYPSDSCGEWKHMGTASDEEACMELVKETGILAFAYESGGRLGLQRVRFHLHHEPGHVRRPLRRDLLSLQGGLPGGPWTHRRHQRL